jgi:hypothetical protein
MPKNNKPEDQVDWSLATWEGSRREKLRRWAKLPLERVIAALEEMQEVSEALSDSRTASAEQSLPTTGGTIQEQQGKYDSKANDLKKPKKRGGNDG